MSFWRRPAGNDAIVTGTSPADGTGIVRAPRCQQVRADRAQVRKKSGRDLIGVDLVAGEEQQVRSRFLGVRVVLQRVADEVVDVRHHRRAVAVQLEAGAVVETERRDVRRRRGKGRQLPFGVAEATLVVVGRVARVEELQPAEIPLARRRLRPDAVILDVERDVVAADRVGRSAGHRRGDDREV